MNDGQAAYVGTELELFRHAGNWKRYFSDMLEPYVRGHVLDVGCGLGVNADRLWNEAVTTYTFLEPDNRLLEQVPLHVRRTDSFPHQLINGTITALPHGSVFDTILYLDVIEHIEDARAELRRAHELLAPGGHLLILVPAVKYLYSEFDEAIGHYRRYNKSTLCRELPPELEQRRMFYLDSLGFFASLANKWFLGQSTPSLRQVIFWDRRIVPLSRLTDLLVFRTFGRSLISVSRKC